MKYLRKIANDPDEYKYENNLRVEKIIYDPKGKVKTKKAYIYTTW